VVENKGYHFFDLCKLRAFCVQNNTNYASDGAKTPRFAQNEAEPKLPQNAARKTTNCRLHKSAIARSAVTATAFNLYDRTG
jgi:hypothetical protein